MRKIFNKVLAGVTSVALVATLLVGINVNNSVSAADAVTLNKWKFTQGGEYNAKESYDQTGNCGYIDSVKMNGTNELINGWLRTGEASVNQAQSATQASTGFEMAIADTGWDAQWKDVTGYDTDRINPWAIQALMPDVAITPGHDYTVTFKAKASKKKYAYVAFGSTVDGVDMPPYSNEATLSEGSDGQIITLGTVEQTYTYKFTNWVSAASFTTTIMLGAFDAQYDYAGNYVGDIITAVENDWSGTVIVSDFTITDEGRNKDFEERPSVVEETTTAKPSNGTNNGGSSNVTPQPSVTTKSLAKVTGVKVKNTKKKTVKVTWKKVTGAAKYQIKLGTKTYTSTKNSKTIKSSKVKKGKRVSVKVRAVGKTGYVKYGAWSKTVKKKITK